MQSKALAQLTAALHRLPGVGPKMAERLALFIIRSSQGEVDQLLSAISQAKTKIRYCSICFDFTEQDPCSFCQDATRDQSALCVVEKHQDLLALERSGSYKGRYHVLQGLLSPLEGVGPEDIRVQELITRLRSGAVEEIILATNPSVEGEATATYIAKIMRPLKLKITRIAQGIPRGGDLEYQDHVTLARAMDGRRELDFR